MRSLPSLSIRRSPSSSGASHAAAPMVCMLLAAVALIQCGATSGAPVTRSEGVIPPEAIAHEHGFCYIAPINAPCAPDSNAGADSCLRLQEDGRDLGPPHSSHQHIRDSGRGAYSHWSGDPARAIQQLYFSTSDNSDPRTNGRTYRWVVLRDAAGRPIPPRYGEVEGRECRLVAVPTRPLARDRHTTLLASFDAKGTNDAEYARVHRTEVGVGSKPAAPGRFGDGVSVEGPAGSVTFPGLDNYHPLHGTVEFWAQSRAREPIWADGKEHWLLVLYPERAGAGERHGMAPYFIALCKSAENTLELRVVRQSMAPYSVAVGLRQAQAPTIRLPVDRLAPRAWHHLLVSWDFRGSGRLWLLVDGVGLTADLGFPPGRPAPNPGGSVVLGGLWGLPGDNVLTSCCNLDDLRIQVCTVADRLAGARPATLSAVDQRRWLQEMDLARALLDRLMAIQFRGGWSAGYHWPTYTPSGWSQVGRGVDMWFAHSAWAGNALMRGWLLWGDDRYLDAAIEAADMFCKTQLANGSWAYHYTYTRGEFVPWSTHAYIAQSMQSNQLRFLCLMYRLLGYERYERAIRKVADWMVSIQFPSGAWGWEAYPLGATGPYGHPALNDAVTPQAMWDLFVIWCATGERRYLDSVLKGARWICEAQAKAPTFGWADQYDEQNNFIWMRGFEPPAVSMQAISSAVWGLCLAYDLTGDPQYLEPMRKVLTWMDTVPEKDRGWLWYDPKTNVPVVAYYNEMLPVTHPRAIKEFIPRLDAHYGTKFPWQADRIRRELKLRESGPVYPDWRGMRPRSELAKDPTVEEFAAVFAADRARAAREHLAAWAAGKPTGNLVSFVPEYGRGFEIGTAISYCEALLSDLECGMVAVGDIPPERIPRYARGGNNNWVYMEPARDYMATPLQQPR